MADTPAPQYQKFAFDTEFFELVPGTHTTTGRAAAPGTPARPSASPRQRAYDEGYAAGLKEGQKQAEADLAKLQQNLHNTLSSLQTALAERERLLAANALAFLRVTLHHIVGDILKRYPEDMLEQHLRTLIPLLKTDESLSLRVHPLARGYHEKLQLSHASILGLPMHIVPDTALGLTDAIVEWKNGGVESKLEHHLAAIDRLLAANGINTQLPTPPMEATPPPEKPAPSPLSATAEAQAPAPLEQASQAAQSRAAELLGDDELVDALKTK